MSPADVTEADARKAGFRDRAISVEALLAAPETGFVLVTSPRRDAMEEAQFFAHQLDRNGQTINALIVNRVHPHFGAGPPAAVERRAQALEGTALAPFAANLADFASLAATEDGHLAGLTGRVAPAPVVKVPFLDTDVHDLSGLDRIATHLFPDAAARAGDGVG